MNRYFDPVREHQRSFELRQQLVALDALRIMLSARQARLATEIRRRAEDAAFRAYVIRDYPEHARELGIAEHPVAPRPDLAAQ